MLVRKSTSNCNCKLLILIGAKKDNMQFIPLPIGSMYGIFTYIWLIFKVNVSKYTIHGSYGLFVLYFPRQGSFGYEHVSPEKEVVFQASVTQALNCFCFFMATMKLQKWMVHPFEDTIQYDYVYTYTA